MSLPLVTVQILNWNRPEETVRAIESSLSQSYSNIEIVVVDNCSTDYSNDMISSLFKDIKIVKLDKNYGCPGGRNRGVDHCNGEYIFFCDNDGILHKDAVKNAVDCILNYKDALIVSGQVMDFSVIEEVDTQFELGHLKYREVCGFRGGVTLHAKTIYKSISEYPDDYMYGGEETFLSLKVLDKGYKIVHCDQVILWHKKSVLARDVKAESLISWRNKLTNIYRLYPLLLAVPFILRFILVYQYYALRDGYYVDYIRCIPSFFIHATRRKREPVKLSVVMRYLATIE